LGNGGGETQNNHGEREKDSGNNIISKKILLAFEPFENRECEGVKLRNL